LGGLRNSPFDNADTGGIQILSDELCEKRGSSGSKFGGFDDRAIARGDRTEQRTQDELKRIVPRPDDENQPQRFRLDIAFGRLKSDWAIDLTFSGPETQATNGILGFGSQKGQFGAEAFEKRLSHVRMQSIGNLPFMLTHEMIDRAELLDAPRDRS